MPKASEAFAWTEKSPEANAFALGTVIDVVGGVLSTTTVSESEPVFPRPSVIVAVSVCAPSVAELVAHGETTGAPSSVRAIVPEPTALVPVAAMGVEPRTNVHGDGEVRCTVGYAGPTST